jgi:hypothetical protein
MPWPMAGFRLPSDGCQHSTTPNWNKFISPKIRKHAQLFSHVRAEFFIQQF